MKTETFKITEREGVTLTTYLLDTSKEMPNMQVRPAILVIPGGGYHFCSDREAEPVAMEFLARGYNAFVLRYSIKENSVFPNPLRDAETALEMIRDNAEEWGVCPEKIAAIGFSAGGHLTAALSTIGRVRPNAAILGYPCILDTLNHILANDIESADKDVDENTPPTFIFAASDDGLVPVEHSIAFSSALAKNKIPFEMHIFSNGGHGFSVASPVVCSTEEGVKATKEASRWVKMCFDWLEKVFK